MLAAHVWFGRRRSVGAIQRSRRRRQALPVAVAVSALLIGALAPATPVGAAVPASELWVVREDGAGLDDAGDGIAVSPDGSSIFVVGTAFGDGADRSFVVTSYQSASGAFRWARQVGTTILDASVTGDVGVSPDGTTVFVAGMVDGSIRTVALDSETGAESWVRNHAGSFGYGDVHLAVSPDGGHVYVAGPGFRSAWLEDYHTLAYDSATGALGWEAWHGELSDWIDLPSDITVSPDGSRVYVTGRLGTNRQGGNYGTVAYRSLDGVQVWEREFDGPPGISNDQACCVEASPDGTTVYVTGVAYWSKTANPMYTTIAYSARNGSRRWISTYDGHGNPRGTDEATAMDLSSDGSRLYVTGRTEWSDGFDYATVAYDAVTGSQGWVARFREPAGGSGSASAVAVDPGNSLVFVTGWSGPPGDVDYVTLSYQADSGAELRRARYGGPAGGDDRPSDLALSPQTGRVFVTGSSMGAGTGTDIATVAYGPSPAGADLAP